MTYRDFIQFCAVVPNRLPSINKIQSIPIKETQERMKKDKKDFKGKL